jgi:hypothetical protein
MVKAPAGHGKIVKTLKSLGPAGATIGVAEHSEVILFRPERRTPSAARMDHRRDAGAAVASKGAGANMTWRPQRPVLSFVLGEQCLMGDLSLEGFKIKPKAS